MSQVTVLHGPNLNLLGQREPHIYGRQTLDEVNAEIRAKASTLGLAVNIHQSNHEGVLIDRVQACLTDGTEALIINAGGYTHTSVALRDAVAALEGKVITLEVHLSVPEAREPFRHHSYLAPVVLGRIEGLGGLSYLLALQAASALIGGRGHVRDQRPS